ncbi:bifunctional DNA primase/polymerase [Streptomyces anulatus]|uniref:bifunctional DNA primase/polymerase n=1 Tax=Streptomyces TaxID=1883 RepID=UPI00093B476A|nr:bifunctional DNA primase/polymerase [Streptomyces sp. TSRI0395]OKI81838.1 DNA primase [Streptomyces sp. TSRI0395]
MNTHLTTALRLAAAGVPVMPLSADKRPVANCPACAGLACGGRPNMKTPGPCTCPAPCHAWAAATTDPDVITGPTWSTAWKQAAAIAYHPGGISLTVVDLDHADAVTWARRELPATRTVPTTRGEHWIYRGAMQSANHVRDGVDIKSAMSYARWRGPGTGTMTVLPDVVRGLVVKEETTSPRGGVVSSPSNQVTWEHRAATGCRHTERYVRTGLERGLALVRARRESGAGSQAFGVAQFIAKQHTDCPGPCGLDVLGQQIITTAMSMGVPEPYATRAVTNGLAGAA